MPKQDRYSKGKKEKIVQAAKGCRSLTYIFETLVYLHFTIIFFITQAVCGSRCHILLNFVHMKNVDEAEAYSEPFQTSKIQFFAKKVNG